MCFSSSVKWGWWYYFACLSVESVRISDVSKAAQKCEHDYKEQDVQLWWRGSELRVSCCTCRAEQLADELAWPVLLRQISSQLACLWARLISHVRTYVFQRRHELRKYKWQQSTGLHASVSLNTATLGLVNRSTRVTVTTRRPPVGAWLWLLWPLLLLLGAHPSLLALLSAHGACFLVKCTQLFSDPPQQLTSPAALTWSESVTTSVCFP